MRYMILIYGDEKKWADATPEQGAEVMSAYMAYTNALRASGAYIGGEPLHPTQTATTIRGTEVSDGPYAETKEQLGGYYLIDVPNLDSAIEWGKRCPAARYGSVEVRPVMVFAENQPNAAGA
jgi:hypothetical protein